MAKKFGFFNSINGDRKYLASDIAEAFGIGITTGLKSEEGNLQIVPYQNMQIKINPGGAMIFGHFYLNDEDELIDIDIADGELNRIDRIVLRYDKYERSIKTVVVKGTPALNPVAPTRLETNEQFDLVLADIYVPKAATSITTGNITDMRESELCGYIGVKGAVSQLDFDSYLADNAKLSFYGVSTNQSIANDSFTKIFFDTKTAYNNGDNTQINNGEIEVLKDGLYQGIATIRFTGINTGYIEGYSWINNSAPFLGYVRRNAVNGFDTILSFIFICKAISGDKISINVKQNSGKAIDVVNSITSVSIKKVG